MSGRLDGKVAVVTGAGSGLGKATAELFHREGAKVIAGDISGRQEETAASLGDRAIGVRVDVSDRDAVARMIDAGVQKFGSIDVVANVAGIDGPLGPLVNISPEDFQRLVDVNLKGPLNVMQAAIPVMLEGGGGSIVNVASNSAERIFPMIGGYAATKAALVALSRAFAVENATDGIRVNVVNPGVIDTPMSRSVPPEAFDAAIALTPMKRPSEPGEIAKALLYLASDESSFATGTVLTIDGGMTI
jgi:NAD(P)-dependent dehydrogenase (short-subunit alcohol dehydrogenase family)